MKKILAIMLATLLVVGLVSAAVESTYRMGSIFDPVSRKNIPYWKLSEERLQELMNSENLNSIKWNKNRNIPTSIPKAYTGRMLGKTEEGDMTTSTHDPTVAEKKARFEHGKYVSSRTLNKKASESTNKRLITAPDVGRKGKYMSTEEIVAEFGITEIFDPAFKRYVDVNKLSKQRLIEYLNNPLTQEMTFGDKTDVAQAKVEELGITTGTRHYQRGRKVIARPGKIQERRIHDKSGEITIVKSLGSNAEKVTI